MWVLVIGMEFAYMALASILAGLEEWVGLLVAVSLFTLCCCTLAIVEAIEKGNKK